MSGHIMLSKVEADAIQYLRPHYGIHDYSTPGKLNKNIQIPTVTVGNIANWIEDECFALGVD